MTEYKCDYVMRDDFSDDDLALDLIIDPNRSNSENVLLGYRVEPAHKGFKTIYVVMDLPSGDGNPTSIRIEQRHVIPEVNDDMLPCLELLELAIDLEWIVEPRICDGKNCENMFFTNKKQGTCMFCCDECKEIAIIKQLNER